MTETTIMLMHMSSPMLSTKTEQRPTVKLAEKKRSVLPNFVKRETYFVELICNLHLISIGQTKFVFLCSFEINAFANLNFLYPLDYTDITWKKKCIF